MTEHTDATHDSQANDSKQTCGIVDAYAQGVSMARSVVSVVVTTIFALVVAAILAIVFWHHGNIAAAIKSSNTWFMVIVCGVTTLVSQLVELAWARRRNRIKDGKTTR